MKIFNLFFVLCLAQFSFTQTKLPNQANLPGNWMGIDLYQDQETYDGKNYFLPNEEFIVISPEKIKIYFYPFSKSDEFDVLIDEKQIKYQFGKRKIETNYSFTNSQYDTLVFTMHFINKTFVKMYSRVTSINSNKEIDYATIKELDQFGFNPSAITHLFELDTFHRELYIGFSDYSELNFQPYQFLQFINDNSMSINRKDVVNLKRDYKIISFEWEGRQEVIQIQHSEGTQSFSIIPTSLCQCDTIVIPYLTVDWADRIRKDMRENSYKYKK
jgi:hypothetical protein